MAKLPQSTNGLASGLSAYNQRALKRNPSLAAAYGIKSGATTTAKGTTAPAVTPTDTAPTIAQSIEAEMKAVKPAINAANDSYTQQAAAVANQTASTNQQLQYALSNQLKGLSTNLAGKGFLRSGEQIGASQNATEQTGLQVNQNNIQSAISQADLALQNTQFNQNTYEQALGQGSTMQNNLMSQYQQQYQDASSLLTSPTVDLINTNVLSQLASKLGITFLPSQSIGTQSSLQSQSGSLSPQNGNVDLSQFGL